MRIFKYPIDDDGGPSCVKMPYGAIILTVAMQEGQGMMVWAKVDTKAPIIDRVFHVVATGGQPPLVTDFVGTVFTGPFVWHVFVEREPFQPSY